MCKGCARPLCPASTLSGKVTAHLRHARQAGHSACRGHARASSGSSTSAFTNSESPLSRLHRHLCKPSGACGLARTHAARRRRRSSVGSRRQRHSGRRLMMRSRPIRRRRVDAIGCDGSHGVPSSSVLCVLCLGMDSRLWLPSRKQAAGLVRPAVVLGWLGYGGTDDVCSGSMKVAAQLGFSRSSRKV
jgi:hypothetical protein